MSREVIELHDEKCSCGSSLLEKKDSDDDDDDDDDFSMLTG
jgi:hypothetical protein